MDLSVEIGRTIYLEEKYLELEATNVYSPWVGCELKKRLDDFHDIVSIKEIFIYRDYLGVEKGYRLEEEFIEGFLSQEN